MKLRNLGWVPDVPDFRDYPFKLLKTKKPTKLPASVDLRPTCSPVEDQGNLGSCTANALAGAVEFLEKKDKVLFVDASRLFIYYNERVIEHSVTQDSGAMLRDGIKTLVAQGVCSEANWPYVEDKFAVKPPAACYAEAANRQVTSYYRINTLNDMKTCLATGFPFVFGIAVYESFMSDTVDQTGVVPMPQRHEQMLGGHALLCVGYDDARSRFYFRNSWGASWGMKGYGTIPYMYLTNSNLADDFWSVRRGEEM
jgi:C1A family cysteine protease